MPVMLAFSVAVRHRWLMLVVVTEAKVQLMLRIFGLSVAISPTKSGSGERRRPADANDAWASRGAKQSPLRR